MSQYLVVSALGPDRAGIVDEMSECILTRGGNINESRMSVLGGEFALIMLISGNEQAIEKVQSALRELQPKLGLTVTSKRTTARALREKTIPYGVRVVAMDHPGIVHDVSDFFANRHINIEHLETGNYSAPHTGTVMFSLDMTVGIPGQTSTSQLKKEFLSFCDELNLDAEMEARK